MILWNVFLYQDKPPGLKVHKRGIWHREFQVPDPGCDVCADGANRMTWLQAWHGGTKDCQPWVAVLDPLISHFFKNNNGRILQTKSVDPRRRCKLLIGWTVVSCQRDCYLIFTTRPLFDGAPRAADDGSWWLRQSIEDRGTNHSSNAKPHPIETLEVVEQSVPGGPNTVVQFN